MQMKDYLITHDELASEDMFYGIPLRKEYFLTRIGSGKRVLDAGCLGGKISRLILENKNQVWGIEVNPSAAALAKQRGIQVKVADIEDGLPFDDQQFDVVIAGEVLGCLYDTKFFFQEAWRVLAEGGVLLLTTPNLNSWVNRFRVATGGYLSLAGAYPEDHFGENVRFFNKQKIEEICWQTGFDLVDTRGIPILKSWGKAVDTPLGWVGRVFPSLSKIFMMTAKKRPIGYGSA